MSEKFDMCKMFGCEVTHLPECYLEGTPEPTYRCKRCNREFLRTDVLREGKQVDVYVMPTDFLTISETVAKTIKEFRKEIKNG